MNKCARLRLTTCAQSVKIAFKFMAVTSTQNSLMAKSITENERIRVGVDLSRIVDRAAKIEAAKLGIDKRELIERALRAFLKLPLRAA